MISKDPNYHTRLIGSQYKISQEGLNQVQSVGIHAWRIVHRLMGSLILALGLVNVSLGVFLAVLPLPVWVVWFVYMSLLVITLVVVEIKAIRDHGAIRKSGSLKSKGKQILIQHL